MSHTLIMFTSPTCAPCRPAKPIAEAAAVEAGVEFKVLDVSTDEGIKQASEWGINATPTFVLTEDHEGHSHPLGGMGGFAKAEVMKAWLSRLMLGNVAVADVLAWLERRETVMQTALESAKVQGDPKTAELVEARSEMVSMLRKAFQTGSWVGELGPTQPDPS